MIFAGEGAEEGGPVVACRPVPLAGRLHVCAMEVEPIKFAVKSIHNLFLSNDRKSI